MSESKLTTFNENDNSIIVTLDSSIHNLNDEHISYIFHDYQRENLRELNIITNPVVRELIDFNTFKRIFEIKLNEVDKKNIRQLVWNLSRKEGVYSIEKGSGSSIASEPNDMFYNPNHMWNLHEAKGINATDAWDITTGSKSVRVGVIDSGISNHEDLIDNLDPGWDSFSDNAITSDDVTGHGTHVAGIIGATGNNLKGVVGVNWNVSLVPLQVSEISSINWPFEAIIEAINYAINLWGTDDQIDILNLSMDGYGLNTGVREAIRSYPGLVVWAAGNEEEDIDLRVQNHGTFNLPNIISVGNYQNDGNRSEDSNFSKSNTNVNIYAPGTIVLSTDLDNGYLGRSGTSMAAPHVTGVAALMLSENPNLTASQLKNLIIDNATTGSITIPNGTGTTTQTVKKLNAYNSVSAVHSHSHTKSYSWNNDRTHRAFCDCGNSITIGHTVSSSWDGIGTTTCLLCGGVASMGFVQTRSFAASIGLGSLEVVEYFGHGSYLLSNGFYMISDEDITALQNRTLVLPGI